MAQLEFCDYMAFYFEVVYKDLSIPTDSTKELIKTFSNTAFQKETEISELRKLARMV